MSSRGSRAGRTGDGTFVVDKLAGGGTSSTVRAGRASFASTAMVSMPARSKLLNGSRRSARPVEVAPHPKTA
jgi:hypothetical protein